MAVAQSTLPALGDGLEMSTSQERRLGDRIARELYRSADYLDDAVLGEYVDGIWQRLMAAARARGELSEEQAERLAWEVLLRRDRSVNASAWVGGYLRVHLGLVAAVDSEDELAAVLGHELTHVTQRHVARILSKFNQQDSWSKGALLLGALLVLSGNPNAAAATMVGGQAAAIQGQLNFSRDMEREADRVGYGVMTQAGFDPRGFVGMFEKLEQASRFHDTASFPYLRSHPLTTERIADMQARQQLQPQAAQAPLTTVHAMLAARARVLTNPEVDSLRAALAQAEGATYAAMSPAQRAGVLYAAALAASNLREYSQARTLLDRLRDQVRGHVAAEGQWRLLAAELALQGGEAKRALELLGSPVAGATRPHVLLRARAWTESGRPAQATELLQVWLTGRPRDAQAWQLLSAAHDRQGQALRAIRADAEAHAARLNYAAAQDRLRAAQELARTSQTVDHIEASIIDTRSRELAALLREQALER